MLKVDPKHLFVATTVVLATVTMSQPARAEYVENFMGRDIAIWTLALGGLPAAVFDTLSISELSKGPNRQPLRLAGGVGSTVAGALLIGGSVFALTVMGKEHIPAGGGRTEEQALHTGQALSYTSIGLGVLSIGLGIASLATYRETTPNATSTTQSSIRNGGLSPTAFTFQLPW